MGAEDLSQKPWKIALNERLCPGMHLSPECNCLRGAEKSACHSALCKGEKNWPGLVSAPLSHSSTLAVSHRLSSQKLLLNGVVSSFLTLPSINTEGENKHAMSQIKGPPIYKTSLVYMAGLQECWPPVLLLLSPPSTHLPGDSSEMSQYT